MTGQNKENRIAHFLYEIGTMRKLLRMHRQRFLTDDMSDNIASHSYRVAMTGWFLAKEEGADPYKVVMMCLLHDIGEVRSGDHNWIHKQYIKVFEDEIMEDQLDGIPYTDLKEILEEYEKRESKEAIVAKDADTLDQILLLREYEWQGNKEATRWLHSNTKENDAYAQLKYLKLDSAKAIGKAIYNEEPTGWSQKFVKARNR